MRQAPAATHPPLATQESSSHCKDEYPKFKAGEWESCARSRKEGGTGCPVQAPGKGFPPGPKRQDEGRAYAGWGSRNGMEKPLRLGGGGDLGVTIVTSSCKEVLGDSHGGQTAP